MLVIVVLMRRGEAGRSPAPPLFFAGPFVTSVGGTMSYSPEVAMPISGGGFSLWFSRPKYQQSAVAKFLDVHGDEHADLFK